MQPARIWRSITATAASLLAGCTALPQDTTGLLNTLSGVLLVPGATCEQLQEIFHVEYLPLAGDPGQLGIKYEEHWIPVGTYELIHLWYLPSQMDRGLVIISPGSSGPISCYQFAAHVLLNSGWSVVMYDYEGFGQSLGSVSLSNLPRDLDVVLQWTLEFTGRPQASLMGISLGSIPAIASAVHHPDQVNAVILDSPVALGEEFVRFGLVLENRPSDYLEQLDPDLVSDKLISEMQQPLLVYEQGKDLLTPPVTVERLYQLAPGPKKLVVFPDVQHARGLYVHTAEYVAALDEFLSSVWGQ